MLGSGHNFIQIRLVCMTTGPAMTRTEAEEAIGLGLEIAANEAAAGTSVLGTCEMGIANTTSASAIAAVMTGHPPNEVTGRGTGIDDAGHARKVAAIERALRIHRSAGTMRSASSPPSGASRSPRSRA